MTHLEGLFKPRAVAVIGASSSAGKIGGRIMNTLTNHSFKGKIYPVNPNCQTVCGLPTFPSVRDLPEDADLALIAIPAPKVPDCVRECAEKGIKFVVIFSSGFSESGQAGMRLQEELVDISRKTGIRIAGPNAEGFYSLDNDLAATFSPAVNIDNSNPALENRIDILSQSGGLGFSFYNKGCSRGLCFGHVVTVGNQVDLEISEYADYLIEQPQTRIIMMYVESFKNPQKFMKVADRAGSLGKPIIMVKVGASNSGKRAAESHTGALVTSNRVINAVFEYHGVLTVNDQDALMDLSLAFINNPLPDGNRVAIVTTSGGTAAWLADACEAAGLDVPEIDAERQSRISGFIPSYGAASNPVDITAQSLDGLTRTLEVLSDADYIDSFIVAANFTSCHRLVAEGNELARFARQSKKPIILYSYAEPSAEAKDMLADLGLHCYTSLQGSVLAIRGLHEYSSYQKARRLRIPFTGKDVPAQALETLNKSTRVLSEYEAKVLLSQFGIDVPEVALAKNADMAASMAEKLGYPVALKLQSPDISHKSDAGAVFLNLANAQSVTEHYAKVLANARAYAPEADVHGVLVQKMAAPGLEIIAGIVNDPDFGPMVMVGLGGIFVEILDDVAMAPAPFDGMTAYALLQKLKGFKIFSGVRGQQPKDVEALAHFLVQLSQIAWLTRDSLQELDVNPIFVHDKGKGITIVDALGLKISTEL